jgi:hypothetical protein
MGIPLLVLAVAQTLIELRDPPAERAPGAARRTFAVFVWMTTFIALVLLAGFPVAVPVFVFSYLVIESRAVVLSLVRAQPGVPPFRARAAYSLRRRFDQRMVPIGGVMKSKAIALCLMLAATAPAWAQASFYEGKTVTVVIGASGGSLEIAARLVARHLGKHIPGNPNVIVQNMTGAAHLVATNHVYNVAKPDGLTLLAASPNVGIAQLTKVGRRASTCATSIGSDPQAPTGRALHPRRSAQRLWTS